MLQTSEGSIHSLLRRARAAFETRLPAAGRERAPLPNSKLEREIIGRFAETVENGDIDSMVALLTDDAWLTIAPLPHAYRGPDSIGALLRGAEGRRGGAVAGGGDAGHHAAGVRCYRWRPRPTSRAYSLLVLTLKGNHICAITWFADSSVFPQFGLPRMLR